VQWPGCYLPGTNLVSLLSNNVLVEVLCLLMSFAFCIVAIDGEDVRGMFVSQVTALMASKIAQERRLTVLTSTEFDDLPETKDEDYDE
jgi:hypothetical protein